MPPAGPNQQDTTVANWQWYDRHVTSELKSGEFISAATVLVAAGPPFLQDAAQAFKHLDSIYSRNRDLISVGAYERGSDERIDAAIEAMPALEAFLRQDKNTPVPLEQSLYELLALFPPSPEVEVNI